MKQKITKLLCLLLSAVMLLSLAACKKGGGKSSGDSNLIKLDDYDLLYKSACIMTDYTGVDALVMTLDFTNNGKENASYLWTVFETATQNGTELEKTIVYTDPETLDAVNDSQWDEVEPGSTLEIRTAFALADAANEVEVSFGTLFGSKTGKVTIDPSTLSRETAGSGAAQPAGSDTEQPTESNISLPAAGTNDMRLNWWNGDWYGWWLMENCSGYYADMGMEGGRWDICGTIDIGEDYMGTFTLWDEDFTKAEPMVSAAISLSEDGTTEYGTIMSEGGYFTDIPLEHADWIIDPGLVDFVDTMIISGDYENGADAFTYYIVLRRWGTYWEIDMDEVDFPAHYYDWCVPLID